MNAVNWDGYRFVFDLLQTLFMGALGIYAWWTSRTRATNSAIAKVETTTEQLSRRIEKLEHEIEHLPDHDDIGDIHEKVNQVATAMSNMQGELVGINRTLGLINEYLLNQGGKK
ncbi:DUF2730 family protein [Spongiibacter sp. UBA1325]|uniref:DUF2730 family protein n=1 Tax=Spongiibacter sp. UBA1325 TaxID=1947543 RepID=UPI00258034D6|nr:DUF2730 family protein [Spongiibacter sp. UBA1325]|tara:strand:- start:1312 stop:1653 length:342 start_codon:yes stop_codon:yes gene_type:complete